MNPLVIPVVITQHTNPPVPAFALIDSGATSNFVDIEFVKLRNLQLQEISQPVAIHVIDGRPIESGDITHACAMALTIGKQTIHLRLDVTMLSYSLGHALAPARQS